jgi:gliding motility-associated transport system permease protein
MNTILLIARRELASYFRSWTGYIIIAAVLMLDGLLFNGFALGSGMDRRSSDVLSQFFFFSSGVTMTASVFISMRLLAAEREAGTVNLLLSSPVRDVEIVVGKYLSALAFLAVLLAASVYMPLLVLVAGKISWGHVFAGYLGLFLLGAASLAIGTFGSAVTKSQILAVILSAVMVVALLVMWWVGRVTDRPLSNVFENLALWSLHFPPFQAGIIHVRDVIYYLAVTYVALFGATRVLEARRWR